MNSRHKQKMITLHRQKYNYTVAEWIFKIYIFIVSIKHTLIELHKAVFHDNCVKCVIFNQICIISSSISDQKVTISCQSCPCSAPVSWSLHLRYTFFLSALRLYSRLPPRWSSARFTSISTPAWTWAQADRCGPSTSHLWWIFALSSPAFTATQLTFARTLTSGCCSLMSVANRLRWVETTGRFPPHRRCPTRQK